jgi:predicted nucleic acid-binding protein
MAKNREAYVDTSAFIALADRSDTHHGLFKRLFAEPPPLVTTVLVVAEGHAWFLRRYDRTRALQFLTMVESMTPLSISDVGIEELTAASGVLRKFANQDLTMTDAVGLHLLGKRKIKSCWSTDFHMGLTNVPLIIHSHT